ncbi:MerR family regulatory protein [Nonomuraea solani]|uniref:MerR family regulatory protein n=1 Tax=Nonomuraea solani TaxID=1144553 RepID=A0A1H6BPM5_9ACTN|nr:MerR family regulatory protein [Nonomuraea solani]
MASWVRSRLERSDHGHRTPAMRPLPVGKLALPGVPGDPFGVADDRLEERRAAGRRRRRPWPGSKTIAPPAVCRSRPRLGKDRRPSMPPRGPAGRHRRRAAAGFASRYNYPPHLHPAPAVQNARLRSRTRARVLGGAGLLTIGQLAARVGMTIRAIRHYHQRGLLPEPERDASGYRRYGPRAVVDLIRIKTLVAAGVPLARVEQLLAAGQGCLRITGGYMARLGDDVRRRGSVTATTSPQRQRGSRAARRAGTDTPAPRCATSQDGGHRPGTPSGYEEGAPPRPVANW